MTAKTNVRDLFGRLLTGAIVFAWIVVVTYVFTGRWPDQSILIAASIGTAISPLFWRAVRSIFPEPAPEVRDQETP